MVSNKTKKAICVAVALSLIANLSTQVHASDLVAIPQNNASVIIPQNSSIVQNHSTDFSMESIESKISNVLNPAKKSEVNKVKRKQLEVYSGTCGTNVNWELDTSTGVLTISGSGAMKDYFLEDSPWDSYFSSITSLKIVNGVTSIGESAFSSCSSLTSVTIPSSVTSIGTYAFGWCEGLNLVTYTGTSDPGVSSSDVFDCCNIYCLLVPSTYASTTFCGKSVVKGSCPAPTPTPRPTRSPLPTRSRSPLPTRSRSPLPTRSRSPLPTRSRSPLPTRSRSPLPTRSRSPLPTPKSTLQPTPVSTPTPTPKITKLLKPFLSNIHRIMLMQ